jgi:hypothetical protein
VREVLIAGTDSPAIPMLRSSRTASGALWPWPRRVLSAGLMPVCWGIVDWCPP